MHQQPIPAANLTAATAAGRALLAAGWRYDATSPMADDTTIRTLLHPTGREIHARTVDGGETTALTMTGLSLDQVAGAVLGAGLAPAAPVATRVVKGRYLAAGMTVVYEDGTRDLVTGTIRDGDDVTAVMADGVTASYHVEEGVTVLAGETAEPQPPTETHLRQRFAAWLHRIADDIVSRELPVGTYTRLSLGVLDSRADLERLAGYLGSEIAENGGTANDIPSTEHTINFSDTRWGPQLAVHAQIRPDQPSELERLRAEVAELRAAKDGA